jgi:hypothetical protein
MKPIRSAALAATLMAALHASSAAAQSAEPALATAAAVSPSFLSVDELVRLHVAVTSLITQPTRRVRRPASGPTEPATGVHDGGKIGVRRLGRLADTSGASRPTGVITHLHGGPSCGGICPRSPRRSSTGAC